MEDHYAAAAPVAAVAGSTHRNSRRPDRPPGASWCRTYSSQPGVLLLEDLVEPVEPPRRLVTDDHHDLRVAALPDGDELQVAVDVRHLLQHVDRVRDAGRLTGHGVGVRLRGTALVRSREARRASRRVER